MLNSPKIRAAKNCVDGQGVLAASVFTVAWIGAVITLPAYSWSPSGLIVIGGFAIVSGGLLFTRQESRLPMKLRQILGTFLMVYGVSSVGGGMAGHNTPTAPLRPPQIGEDIVGAHWKTATSLAAGQGLIDAAIASNQRTLILWGKPACGPCTAAMQLGALNPSINPNLAGYRLISIQSPEPGSKNLMQQFGASGLPSLTLMNGDGTVPEYGRINEVIDALKVMDMLELNAQAEAAAR
ncbi:hypothetical protein H8F21_16135 [Pseudomonas sp. P66]|uniref:Thioredoxin domain-containing protein n=1 Tax=Pseudomonas arcuscaelestis TaxID=2710591 RepID=A0ABS2C167_9PSED|nr:hypothetical protein [Pseudomonas arcuscaelestis]MBM5459098.1 hypothetical protein [Pseudomonas arcuscaelestis]